MLKLWYKYDGQISDDVYYIDYRFKIVSQRSWFNDLAAQAIEEIDGNRYIGDGVSESKVFGIIAPESLSGGVKTMIYAMNNPDSVCPLEWLGDNCSHMLKVMSDSYDMTFEHDDTPFIFQPDQKILCLETNEIVVGWEGYRQYRGRLKD